MLQAAMRLHATLRPVMHRHAIRLHVILQHAMHRLVMHRNKS